MSGGGALAKVVFTREWDKPTMETGVTQPKQLLPLLLLLLPRNIVQQLKGSDKCWRLSLVFCVFAGMRAINFQLQNNSHTNSK